MHRRVPPPQPLENYNKLSNPRPGNHTSTAVESPPSGDRRSMRFYGCCQVTGVSFAASNGLPLFQTAQVMRKSLRASITTACVLLNPLALRAW